MPVVFRLYLLVALNQRDTAKKSILDASVDDRQTGSLGADHLRRGNQLAVRIKPFPTGGTEQATCMGRLACNWILENYLHLWGGGG